MLLEEPASAAFVPVQSLDCADGWKSATADARSALWEDGVVLLRNVFADGWLTTIEEGIDKALGGASADVDVVKRDGDQGSFSFSSGAWRSVEEFQRFIFASDLPDIAWGLLGSAELVLFYDFLLIKQPKSDSASTPWHQDHSYYPLNGTEVINSWVALDDIPLESALRFRRASHRPAQLFRAVNFEAPEANYRHARFELPVLPDAAESELLSSPMSAGDMLVWNSYTVHSAPGNRTNRRRAAFSVSWLGDDVVFNGEASLDTYRDPSQVVGESIAGEKFPRVRPALTR